MKRLASMLALLFCVTAAPAFAFDKPSARLIISYPDKWAGQSVTLNGAFMGWTKKCMGGAPVSSQDWVLLDATACIWVNGKMPEGLDPRTANGEVIQVSGVVKLSKRGKSYLEAADVVLAGKK